jgi:uncharacterized protein (TIGR02001 family)
MQKSLFTLLFSSFIYAMPSCVLAEDEGPFSADNFSASVALTSNYIFRGLTISDDDPAVSGSVDWGYMGFYLGVWASSLEAVKSESLEIDYYGGYVGDINNFTYSLDVIYYDYPGESNSGNTDDIGDLAYWEYGGSLSYSFEVDLEPVAKVMVLHSPDNFAETGDATAVESSLDLSLPYDLGLSFHYGRQYLDDDKNAVDDYDYYGASLTKTLGKFDLSVAYTATNDDGETFQGSSTSELYFTVETSF